MGALTIQEREDILGKLIDDLAPSLASEQMAYAREFIWQYYSLDTAADLLAGNWQDTLGATRSFWQFIQQFDPAQPLIRIINPQFTQHGWHSTHTVVCVLHRDMPFVVDSLRMKLNEHGLTIHLLRNGVLQSRRSSDHCLVFSDQPVADEYVSPEAFVYLEIDRIEEPDELARLHEQFSAVLADVARVVDDFGHMTTRVRRLASAAGRLPNGDLPDAEDEVQAFLEWLLDDNFTFLGYEELIVTEDDGNRQLIRPSESLLGLLRPANEAEPGQLALEPFVEHDLFELTERLSFSKASVRSSVHRPAHPHHGRAPGQRRQRDRAHRPRPRHLVEVTHHPPRQVVA